MADGTAPDAILTDASNTLKQRGIDYDGKGYAGGERSMEQTCAIFKAMTGIELSEVDGWRFMLCLKLARSMTGKPKRDTYVDIAGYSALKAATAMLPKSLLSCGFSDLMSVL